MTDVNITCCCNVTWGAHTCGGSGVFTVNIQLLHVLRESAIFHSKQSGQKSAVLCHLSCLCLLVAVDTTGVVLDNMLFEFTLV